jgi:hypothetical protein
LILRFGHILGIPAIPAYGIGDIVALGFLYPFLLLDALGIGTGIAPSSQT